MSDATAVTAIVLFLFFLTGVATGIVVVIAFSARRAHQAKRPDPSPGTPRPGWPYLNEPGPDDDEPDEPPWRQARDGD
jgi:hypothetical protein